MTQTIDAEVETYLAGLKTGDVDQSDIDVWHLNSEPDKAAEYDNDLGRFRRFLGGNGNLQPTDADLGLRIPKAQLVDLLTEFDAERRCLLLQVCYGLDKPIGQGGRLQLVNRGNYHLSSAQMTNEALLKSVYKIKVGGQLRRYFVLNLNRQQPIPVHLAEAYKLAFRKLYGHRNAANNPYVQGYALPVKAMLRMLDDSEFFRNETHLSLRWGLTKYVAGGELGNVSLYIRGESPDNDVVISYQTTVLSPPSMSDCPPKVPCQS